MSAVPHYPSGIYHPAPLIDLSDDGTRARLSGPARQGFLNLATRWRLRDGDARALLGGMSHGSFYEWKRGNDRTLDVDTLTRISYLVGIFTALNVLYGEELADAWVTLPNTNPLFGGRRPLDCMIAGGLPALQVVRRLLDARRGG